LEKSSKKLLVLGVVAPAVRRFTRLLAAGIQVAHKPPRHCGTAGAGGDDGCRFANPSGTQRLTVIPAFAGMTSGGSQAESVSVFRRRSVPLFDWTSLFLRPDRLPE
jgi:hypothetical protein